MDIFDDIFILDVMLGYNQRPAIHKHDMHEFFFCAEGCGTQHLQGKTVKMEKGDFFFFPEGQLHLGNRSKSGICRGYVLNARESLLKRISDNNLDFGLVMDALCKKSFSGKIRLNISSVGKEHVRDIFEEMIDENRKRGLACGLAVKSCIERLAVTILREMRIKIAKEGDSKFSADERIKNLCRFIQSNYMYDINIARATSMTGLSRSHFHSAFLKSTGVTFTNYLNRVRVGKAIELLEKKGKTTEETAHMTGFKSLSHFYLVFRTITGKKPSSLRQKILR